MPGLVTVTMHVRLPSLDLEGYQNLETVAVWQELLDLGFVPSRGTQPTHGDLAGMEGTRGINSPNFILFPSSTCRVQQEAGRQGSPWI